MQLQKWTTVNRRLFASGSGPSRKEWEQMVKDGVINGRILGTSLYIDLDELASNTVLSPNPENDIPDLLG